jgi:hypothetical protein
VTEGSRSAVMMHALRHVPPNLHSEFEARVAAGDWRDALYLVPSEQVIATLRGFWRRVPMSQQAAVLAEAISSAGFLALHLPFLLRALRSIRERGDRVFDGGLARTTFAQLPDQVTAYRGAVEAEIALVHGISWTLDRQRAVWFTTNRARNWKSPAVLLTVSVARDDIAGMLLTRGEAELLLEPQYTVRATVKALDLISERRVNQSFPSEGKALPRPEVTPRYQDWVARSILSKGEVP